MKSLTQEEGVSGVLSYGLYKIYRSKLDSVEKKTDLNVSWAKWLRICKKFNTRKMESVLKGYLFKMPYRLGTLGIVQYKRKIKFDENGKLITKGLVPDWNKTWKLWKELYPNCKTNSEFKAIKGKPIVFNTNEHSDGRIFRFHWKKKYCNIKNIKAYELIVAPQYKQALGRLIKERNNIQFCTKF